VATTPNTYGQFIGRVGALAVALGIGAAIANSPGIALAEDGPSGTSGATGSAGTSKSGTTAGTSTTPATTGSAKDSEDSDAGGTAANGQDGQDANEADADEQGSADDIVGEASASGSDGSDAVDESSDPADDAGEQLPSHSGKDNSRKESAAASRIVAGSTETDEPDTDIAEIADSQNQSAESALSPITPQAAEKSDLMSFASVSEPSTPTAVTTSLGGFVGTVLSAFGFGPQATTGPTTPPQPPLVWAMLGWVRREVGNVTAPFVGASGTPVAALITEDASITADSPLATDEQLAAEKLAAQTASTWPVALAKIFLHQQFLSAAQQQYPNGLDAGSLAALDKAVNEYAMAAAFQQQILDSMNPTVVTQVAPPHVWFDQSVPGSRLLYDNPDTIYRFMGVNGASEYEIHGQFLNYKDKKTLPADTSFSVLEGVGGTTSSILTGDELEVDPDGSFVITVSTDPADGRPNHLQLTSGSTLIAARNTLGNWNEEDPISLSIERVGGPPDSLFAQIGGFAFLGPQVASNPTLTALVSLVPPLPDMPPDLRGVFTAAILLVRGSQEAKYMALASTDPDTSLPRPANTVSQPSSNAEFLANQLQSNGYYELEDGQALVLTIDPGRANYFIVPTYDIWTITDDYWNKQTSLNNEQAIANADGTYTVVISPTDPHVTNWIDTGGLHQGTISIRFQDLDPDPNDENAPRILEQKVIDADDAADYYAAGPKYVVTDAQRQDQLDARLAGFNKRWAPYPQP
jgi:hypothetical protein